MQGLRRELLFLFRSKTAAAVLAAGFLMAVFAVVTGLQETAGQKEEIARLQVLDQADRVSVLAEQSDYGGVAYYSFHLTYDAPSSLAFAALGQRDTLPWKHRIRMLALEGQIYESDAGNPALAKTGRFDFAFLGAFILPLLITLLLFDLRASERRAGRHDLLEVTGGARIWFIRLGVRCGSLYVLILLPFIVGAVLSKTSFSLILAVSGMVLLHITFWAILGYLVSRASLSAPVCASVLVGVWLTLSFLIPALGDVLIEQAIPSTDGGEIMLAQREAVNDAWDLPKSATMQAFLERHPEWEPYGQVERPFEWKWYYAFQQVGDQKVEELSKAYRDAALQRYRMAGSVALASPPALFMRVMNRMADTDLLGFLSYEQRVRDFHAQLRRFYYPLLFRPSDFDANIFKSLPVFTALNEVPDVSESQ